jgi:hypothetical protein
VLLFPAVVTLSNDTTFSPVMVYATPAGTDVWVWDAPTNSAVVLVHGPGMIDASGTPDVYTLTVDDGTDCRIVYDPRACGCGHPLKRFRPTSGSVSQYAPG